MKWLRSTLLATLALLAAPVVVAQQIGVSPIVVAVTAITGLGTNVATFLATPSSANLAAAVTDETGTGANVFAIGPLMSGDPIINDNATAPVALAGATLNVASTDTTPTRIVMDAYAAAPIMTFRRADTTAASKSAVQNGDSIGSISAFGYGATGYASGGRAALNLAATEAWSDTAQGANVTIAATKNTTLTTSTVALFDGIGHVRLGISGTVPAITSCGTSPSAARGTDFGGEVTEGTTATGCTISFANAYTTAPFCVVSLQTQQVAFTYTISTSAITVTNTSATGDKIDWICNGN